MLIQNTGKGAFNIKTGSVGIRRINILAELERLSAAWMEENPNGLAESESLSVAYVSHAYGFSQVRLTRKMTRNCYHSVR